MASHARPNPERRAASSLAAKRESVLPLILRILLIAACGWWIYDPALHGEFLWDDKLYITRNPLLQDPDRLWKAWFDPTSFLEYYPIHQTVQWLQWQWSGNDPFGYHVTNLVLHIGNGLLVWKLLGKFNLRNAWLGGLLFVIHPRNVESVAWISELKNTLSLPFLLISLCSWIDFQKTGGRRSYYLSFGCFLLSMLCKVAAAPVPAILLLYVWWRHGRIGWKDVKSTLPFFAVSLVLIAMSSFIGHLPANTVMAPLTEAPVGGVLSKIALAGSILAVYFAQVVWPVGMLPIYSEWQVNPPSFVEFIPWLVVAIVVASSWRCRRTWGRHLLLGLGFFGIALSPFLGFYVISYMGLTWVMDHLLYLPMIGLLGLIVAGLDLIDARLPATLRIVRTSAITLIIALLAIQAHAYAGAFTNGETLWGYTVDRNPTGWVGQGLLGQELANARPDEAMAHFETEIALHPNGAEGHADLASTLVQLGQIPAGMKEFETALQLDPRYLVAQNNYAVVLARVGRLPEAVQRLRTVIASNPRYLAAHGNLANALFQSGNLPEAIEQYQAALALDPNFISGHNNLGIALYQQGKIGEARAQFETVLKLDPENQTAQSCLANLNTPPTSARPK